MWKIPEKSKYAHLQLGKSVNLNVQPQHAVCGTNVPNIFTPAHSKPLLFAHFAISCKLDDEGGDEACGSCRNELYGGVSAGGDDDDDDVVVEDH